MPADATAASTRRSTGRADKLASSAVGPSSDAVAVLSGRDRILIWCCLIAAIALAWGYLFFLDRQMMPARSGAAPAIDIARAISPSWDAAELLFTFLMWLVMMIGMMAAPAAPVLLLFAAMQKKQPERAISTPVMAFAARDLVLWAGFSALATLVQWALQHASLLSPEM